ncbi:SAM-dependent methyltransferase [Mucilaginibacter galii]|uniref:SAM-dependent methyltransferase n=1 Tax=Mucilaginibacter galii TaxID=2005073 RepID=A0A917N2Q0_9SPHI|nr:SAM-dependent methyltransferase [Mucilaginibacter galii]
MFYNNLSAFYPLIDVFLKSQKKVLVQEINAQQRGALLEIGVGNGAHLRAYKKHKITGIDISPGMLEVARKQNCADVELYQMDGKALAFKCNQFDYVVLSHVIAVVDDADQLMREVERVLKPKGKVFILNHFTPENWLKYIDYAFSIISRFFHFKSVFHIQDVNSLNKLSLIKEVGLGLGSYYKLLIFQKDDKEVLRNHGIVIC